jgi:hypothetical protein
MVATRRQKQALVSSNPLRDTGILQHVFKYLPGCWLFLGAVCREWKLLYADMGDYQVWSCSLYSKNKLLVCGSASTLFSAILTSPATARLACESGLLVHSSARLQQMAGLLADMEMLLALRELSMPFSDDVVRAVARSGRISILQHLITEQRCPIPGLLSYYAARSGSITMLEWLRAENLCAFITARVLELQKGVTWQYYSIFAVQAVAEARRP